LEVQLGEEYNTALSSAYWYHVFIVFFILLVPVAVLAATAGLVEELEYLDAVYFALATVST
jgi:hypothetical protein